MTSTRPADHTAADLTPRIRRHYDLLAPFYWLLWGEHVHHGYWDDDADATPPEAAQERLIADLYAFAGSPTGLRLIDVGCGYGSGTLWLDRRAGVRRALGITISPMQRAIAQTRFGRAGLGGRARALLADAQQPWPLDDGETNFVWCCEMTEHLRDRAFWAREAFRVLEPGGTVCLAAWLDGGSDAPEKRALSASVARDTVGYPFSTEDEYCGWLAAAGFTDVRSRVLTRHVVRTWDIAVALRERPGMKRLAQTLGEDIAAYARSFSDQARAYRTGAMDYAFFAARKPAAGRSYPRP